MAQAVRRVRLVANGPMPPSEPILPPPPLATGRVRVAELANSLLTVTLWSAVAALVAGATLQLDFAQRPQDVGFLFGMTTLASWTVLIGGKLTEGRAIPKNNRRVSQLMMGAALGIAAQGLAAWLLVEPTTPGHVLVQFRGFESSYLPAIVPGVLGYAAYFGLVGLGVDWWNLTDRDRRKRFRIFSIVKAGAIALIPSLIFFSGEVHPLAVPVVLMTSAVVQLAAPWNEGAAR